MNILIVEDESLLALELANTISEMGYNVIEYVTTPQKAKEVCQKHDIDLIIMDINLDNKLNGIELYKELHTQAKVLYLTSYVDEETIAQAINTQPLGYLVKPYNEAELSALLKLAEIKAHTIETQTVQLAYGYEFDIKSERLFQDGKHIKLGKKSVALLKMLIEAKGNVVSFEEIEQNLYTETPPSSSSIRTLIYRLRSSLKSDMIENELQYGVRLIM
ncbi:MAG: DNA-binding response regulator [Campylobacterales bacterium]|nr:DNA-binding response regulator [Campylobacterales bacterium]